MKLLRRLRSATQQERPWSETADFAAVRSWIADLDAPTTATDIHAIHLEVLEAFGQSIGFGFHWHQPIESRKVRGESQQSQLQSRIWLYERATEECARLDSNQ